MQTFDTIIIGAGQAGLSMGYILREQGKDFIILETHSSIGTSWQERYDSLTLFTPRRYSSLPGLPFPGAPEGFPTRDETVTYLRTYATSFSLPIHTQTQVTRLTKEQHLFLLETTQGPYQARNVIVATGPFQKPHIPAFATNLAQSVFQVHAADYRKPSQLPEGPLLIVGAGNSGAQIAVECARNRTVYLATAHRLRLLPLRLFGRSIFWFAERLGLIEARTNTPAGRLMKARQDPIFEPALSPLLRSGRVIKKPRAIGAQEDTISFADGTTITVSGVIWATGYISDYQWINIPEALDPNGQPVHHLGQSPISGLMYLGLAFQTSRGSALLGWVGKDAQQLSISPTMTKQTTRNATISSEKPAEEQ